MQDEKWGEVPSDRAALVKVLKQTLLKRDEVAITEQPALPGMEESGCRKTLESAAEGSLIRRSSEPDKGERRDRAAPAGLR